MEHRKVVQIPAREEERVVKTTCDLCGDEIKEPGGYDFDHITVERRSGVAYPDGGQTDYTEFDVCKQCFQDKLVVWFASYGARPRKGTIDH